MSKWMPVNERFILTHDTGLINMPKQFVRWNADDESVLVGTDDGNFYHCPLPPDLRLCRLVEAAPVDIPRYSHRNGETEPPTMNGWYAYDGAHRNAKFGGKMIVEGVSSRGFMLVDGDEYYRFVWVGDDDQTIADFTGRWWGPIALPWEANNE